MPARGPLSTLAIVISVSGTVQLPRALAETSAGPGTLSHAGSCTRWRMLKSCVPVRLMRARSRSGEVRLPIEDDPLLVSGRSISLKAL
jgi:hypothetical protein